VSEKQKADAETALQKSRNSYKKFKSDAEKAKEALATKEGEIDELTAKVMNFKFRWLTTGWPKSFRTLVH
jgi:hypothetical protein